MAGNVLIAELPIGELGLNGNVNQSQVPRDALIVANNITYENGTLQKEGGAAKLNTTAISGGPKITGAWDWHPIQGSQRTVIFTDDGSTGKVHYSTGTNFATMSGATGMSVTGDVVPFFVEGGNEVAANSRKLFVFSGNNAVKVITGDTASATSDLSSPPTDWSGTNQPTFGLIHEGRLWGGGNTNDPHRLYNSLPSDHENFPDKSIAVYPGEGEKLVGAVSFKGFIVCFKSPRGVYAIDTRSNNPSEWKTQKVNSVIGSTGPLSMAIIDNDVIFMDGGGQLHLLFRLDDGTFGQDNLSQRHALQSFMNDNFNLARLYYARMVYYYAKRQVHIAMAGAGDTTNTKRLIVDLNKPTLPRFSVSDRDVSEAIFLRKDSNNVPRLAIGDDSGFIWDLDQSSRSAEGSGYPATFQIPHLDLSHLDASLSGRRKNGRFLEIVVEPKGNWDLNVDVYWDGNYHETVAFNLGAGLAALGTFVLGTDTLGGSNVLNKRRRITGSGRRISLVGKNSGDAQDFSVSRMLLHFTPGNQRL